MGAFRDRLECRGGVRTPKHQVPDGTDDARHGRFENGHKAGDKLVFTGEGFYGR